MSFPKPATIESITVGDSASCRLIVTPALIETFTKLSQDDNPLHTDDEFAQKLGFEGRVAHGVLALSAISRLIGTRLPGPGSLWISQELDFVTPILVNNTLEARVKVEKVSRAAAIVVLSTMITNVDSGSVVLRGSAKVKIPGQLPADGADGVLGGEALSAIA